MLVTLENEEMANVNVYKFSTFTIVEYKGSFYKMTSLGAIAYAVGFNKSGYLSSTMDLVIEAVPSGDIITGIICTKPVAKVKLSDLDDGIFENNDTKRRYVVIDGDVYRQNDSGAFKIEERDWNLPMVRLV